MNKYLWILVLLLVPLFILGAGCQQTAPETCGNESCGAGTGTTDGTLTTGGAGTSGTAEWCKPGAYWSWSGATDGGTGEAKWVIKGLEQYKGASYCHATLETTTAEAQQVIEYYFREENDETADIWMVIKDKTGKVVMEMHTSGSA